jgi:hypothetical protein
MTKSIPVKKAALIGCVSFGAMGAAIATEALSDINALVAGVAVFFAMLFMNERKGADVATEE